MSKDTIMSNYPDDVKATIEEFMFTLATSMIDDEVPFRIILTDEDKWDRPLPEDHMSSNGYMAIDIVGQTLDLSYYNLDDDVIILTTGFSDGQAYTRVLDVYDIAGIVDINTNSPIFLKPFKSVRPVDEDKRATIEGIMSTFKPKELIQSQDEIYHSLQVLKHFNPELFKD